MVGWWSGRELRALLERHEKQLGAVWPALRDAGVPPAPTPDQLLGLAELLRTAGKSGGDRGAKIDSTPETAVIILSLALIHRLQPALTPLPLRVLVDPAVRLDADDVNSAGRLTARFAELARDEHTPQHLRRWCADAALLCGARCLSGSAPDDPRLGGLHRVVSGAAEQRFAHTGDVADEDTALAHARASYDHRAPGSSGAEEATRLAQLLGQRCSRLRDASPMGDVPDLVRAALAATDPASPHWLAYAATATGAYVTATAHERRSVELLDAALELQRAIRKHPHYGIIRDQMEPTCAGLLAQRFARRRDREILQEALEIYETLYAAQPRRYAADLGRHLQYRYQMRGDTADRRRALDLMGQGLAGPDPSHEAVSSYSAAAVHEFQETGDEAVIERALAVVTPLTAPGGVHAETAPAHRALCRLYLIRADSETAFDHVPAEAAARRALSLARSATDRALALGMLAAVLVYRYRFGRDLAVLDEAIALSREGLDELPDEPGSEQLISIKGSLIMGLSERHTRTGHLAALREAVTVAEELAVNIPQFEAETPVILGNVATLLVTYARQKADRGGTGGAELDRAQRLVERALAGIDPGHNGRHHLVSALGGVLLARFQQPGAGLDDAETAVRHYETALADPPADPLNRAQLYGNLGHALRERHRHSGDREDLDIALAAARKCVRLVPAGHPLHGAGLAAVSWVLRDIAGADGGYDAISDQALTVNAELAADPAMPPAHSVAASVRLAEVAHEVGDEERALGALRTAIDTLPLVVWRGGDRDDHERALSETELGSFAATVALAAGKPYDALELLEAGRGLLAAQALELRTDTDDLAAAHPELADRFGEMRRQLEHATATDDLSASGADRRHRLAREWQETLADIRTRPGFADFLRPPRAGRLLSAGAHGPVVVVTVGRRGTGHALLLDDTGLNVCPLPGLTHQEARERSELLFQAVAAAGRSGLARAFAEQSVADLLDWLWTTIAEPVLDTLGITGPPPPGEEPPRLWWCPSGPLTFLPLHAAGAVPDRVVSSYTPSLAALLRARGRSSPADRDPLIVAVPELDGQAPLPGALREAELAHRVAGGVLWRGEEVRAEAVRNALHAHPWVHFACHGVQDPERPSQGRLLLPDGALSVLDVTRLHLPAAEFAYLSACETAVGGARLPDEALHLAGSLQLAGFSQVIGTLWRVDDDSSAEIAAQVYGRLSTAGPGAPPAARALWHAVRQVRERWPQQPLSWAAHAHSGA
ncbi:CHAT domain-containing protein [Streptomyces sp. NBC_00663]|uniref:CHAT domain-containing protein n=1 Tax=Streptomyces sp. NBC_00663 TaxID=2975801 RepID=UPI002E320205|nr:CHAT domain-containing protein [Streptomyces sp. NBC_00663]